MAGIAGPGALVSSKKETPNLILLKFTENAVNNNPNHLKHILFLQMVRGPIHHGQRTDCLSDIFGGMTRYTFAPSAL